MKTKLIIYRLLMFMMLPLAGIIAVNTFVALPSALANPLLLIVTFVYFAVVAYTFASFVFFLKGIQNGKALKPSLKDWIKVNAIVTLLFAGFAVLCALLYFSSTLMQKAVSDNFDKIKAANSTINVDKTTFLKLIKGSLIFLGCYGAVLIVHIIMTFGLMKQYAALFAAGSGTQVDDELR